MIVGGIPMLRRLSSTPMWFNPRPVDPGGAVTSRPARKAKAAQIRELGKRDATGFLGRPSKAERAENRERMIDETGDAMVKWGMVAGTLLFSPNPIMKVWALLQALGIDDQPVGQ